MTMFRQGQGTMTFPEVTFVGPSVDDPELMVKLPAALGDFLRETNGLVAGAGAFHLRGASQEPTWHSLRDAWEGPRSFQALYRAVHAEDVPFAEEALGDQFLLREGVVYRLDAETGDLVSLNLGFTQFMDAVAADPLGALNLAPLRRFRSEGGSLQPGQLLSAYPPFCTKESGAGVSLGAIDTFDRRAFLAHFAQQVAGVPDGGTSAYADEDLKGMVYKRLID